MTIHDVVRIFVIISFTIVGLMFAFQKKAFTEMMLCFIFAKLHIGNTV